MIRRPARVVALRAAAVVLAVATAALVASDLAALHRRVERFGEERGAVVARRDLPVGASVDATDVRVRRVHASQLPSGVLDSSRRAIGRVVTTPVLRDGFVADRNLAPRRRTGFDGAIPEGMRAMRIVVTDALRPRVGAAVDVIATFGGAALGLEASLDPGAADGSVVVAEGVLVLAVDASRTAEGAPARGVTLLVTPREARELAFAVTHGVLTISLVPPEDAR